MARRAEAGKCMHHDLDWASTLQSFCSWLGTTLARSASAQSCRIRACLSMAGQLTALRRTTQNWLAMGPAAREPWLAGSLLPGTSSEHTQPTHQGLPRVIHSKALITCILSRSTRPGPQSNLPSSNLLHLHLQGPSERTLDLAAGKRKKELKPRERENKEQQAATKTTARRKGKK